MIPIDLTDRRRIRRYLLGQLPPEERDAIESRYFADPEYFDLVDAEAEHLADDATRNLLSAEERVQFAAIAGQPAWQRRLEFTTLLAEALRLSPSSGGARSPVQRVLARIRDAWQALGTPLQFAAAAVALLLALGWPLMLAGNRRTANRLAELETAAEQRRVADKAHADSIVTSAQLQVAQLEQQVQTSASTRLLLLPGALRGKEDALLLTPGLTYVDLELGTDAPVPFRELRVSIRDAAGRLVRQERVTNPGSAAPVVRVPVATLTEREYQVTLEGMRANNTFDEVAQYTLLLRRR